MNFGLDEMQMMLKDSAARYLERNYSFAQRQEIIATGSFSEERWAWFAQMGWLGAGLPEDVGGIGGGAIETALLMEEFGRRLVVDPFLPVAVLSSRLLLAVDDHRAKEMLAGIASGEGRPILAHSEPAAHGVSSWVETEARLDDAGGWIIEGRKSLVWGGPFADIFILPARTFGEPGDERGISLFLVPVEAPGLHRTDIRLADNSRASELLLRGLRLPKSALLGPEGEGFGALDVATSHAIVAMAAEAVGAMEHVLWTTRDYLKTRRQFGQPLGDFQVLQHRMAEMLIEVELARSSVHRGLAFLDASPAMRRHATSATKIQIAKSARLVGGQAIQLHGAIGVTEEYEVGHYFKRLIAICNAFGPAEVHLKRLAGLPGQFDF